MVSRVGEHGEVARSLDGAGERPLALGAHARLPAGLDLGLVGEEASEEVDVLVVDLLALDARTYPSPPGEVPSARPARAATRPSLIWRARSPLRRARRPPLRRTRRPPLWRSRRPALIRWLSCHVSRLPRLFWMVVRMATRAGLPRHPGAGRENSRIHRPCLRPGRDRSRQAGPGI